ncbi:DUF2750 domain-containing protein [Leptospira interrogans]|uniref:DUF2750 domain-containing protein n=1 Tax=Leptospira interrogans TaxID=173 RepID=UPI0007743CCB|nr:DUF2750 domain-containing protein [Leptospira interrogans]
MKISQKQIEAIIALSGPIRYKHFIKTIADREEVWGLFNDGWALATTDDNERVFPLWPAIEYAQLCAANEWADYKPVSFSLTSFMDELLPNLKNDGVLAGIFFTPQSKGVTQTVDQLLEDINIELEKYY